MKFKLLLIVGVACLVALCSARPAEEDYAEYEDEPAPPPKPVAVRPSPLKGRRNPLSGRAPNNKAASSTTTAAPKEEEIVDEDEPVEEPAEQTSTTESPKKIKTGVRPFRSNDDLLAALKRRREQAASNHKSQPKVAQDDDSATAEVTPSPNKSRVNNGRKRFNAAPKNTEAAASHQDEVSTPAPARTGRRFSARN